MRTTDRLEYLAFRLGLGLLRGLSPEAATRLLLGVVRRLGFWSGLRREQVSSQMAAVFPERLPAEREQLVDDVYRHLARTVAEVYCADPAELAASVVVEPGWQAVDQALSTGRGAIVATAHLGNFELGGRVLAARYSLLDVVKSQRNRLFEAHLESMRHRHHIATVTMDRAAPAVLEQLKRGGLVSLLVDQDAGSAGLALDFLGRPASTWPGAARFALRTGCPVIPMAIIRQPDGGHVLRVGEVIAVEQGPAEPVRVRELMTRISAAVEAFILDRPEQWFWVHRRWKGSASAQATLNRRETACET